VSVAEELEAYAAQPGGVPCDLLRGWAARLEAIDGDHGEVVEELRSWAGNRKGKRNVPSMVLRLYAHMVSDAEAVEATREFPSVRVALHASLVQLAGIRLHPDRYVRDFMLLEGNRSDAGAELAARIAMAEAQALATLTLAEEVRMLREQLNGDGGGDGG
jgi:hypothetical protein